MPDLRPATTLLILILTSTSTAGDFADTLLAYTPAPGQFINNPLFNNPARALGPPVGAGLSAPDNSKLVSLGGPGGSITLRFSPPVTDDPCHPLGLDAIIFSNAFWIAANPNRKWTEAGVIEISRDSNSNGLPDDPWFLIPGSHLPNSPPSSVPADTLQLFLWDNSSSTSTPPANLDWYPSQQFYPGFPPTFTSATFRLPSLFDSPILQNPLGLDSTLEGVWGYADASPTLLLGDTDADDLIDNPALTPADFYTHPDNPFAVGITPGSGGGDAFDIAWAVDPLTGAPAELDRFDFIRITTSPNAIAGALGEISTEIAAVARVRPDPDFFDLNHDSRADLEDLYNWHQSPADLDGDSLITTRDRLLLTRCLRRSELEVAAP